MMSNGVEAAESDALNTTVDIAKMLEAKDVTFFNDVRRKQHLCASEIDALKAELLKVEQRLEVAKAKAKLENNDEPSETAILDVGRKRFNNSAKKGINYLKEMEYFDHGGTEEEIANFLFATKDLSKTMIGEYLGDNKPFNLTVLEKFVNIHKFDSMEFDAALRSYLWSFRLPGESQKIDRMMESFAKRYCECNPNTFRSQDGCYILAFSTIMLNTSLHNPSVAQKLTKEQFVSMNRGIDDGQDIDPELLSALYASILEVPFKIPEDELGLFNTFINPEREGFLTKEGGSTKTWKKRWVVLTNNCLYYFKKKEDETPCGIIPLENLRVRMFKNDASLSHHRFSVRRNRRTVVGKSEYCFELLGEVDENGEVSIIKGCKTNSKGMVVQGKHTRYLFKAEDSKEGKDWVRCIEAAIQNNPFYDLYRNKRNQAPTFADDDLVESDDDLDSAPGTPHSSIPIHILDDPLSAGGCSYDENC